MVTDQRPLSPHLQIYRLPLTALLSIAHRITGAFLVLGVALLAYVLIAAASGPQAYQSAHALVASWFGQLLLFLWTFALYFHFCNGIRHLVWDVGFGFELDVVGRTAWAVIIASGGLTVITWATALMVQAGRS